MSNEAKQQPKIAMLAENILDNLNTAVVLLDSQLCVLCVNSAAEMLLGVSSNKVTTKAIEQFLTDADIVKAIKNTLDTNNPFTQREKTLRLQDHKVIVDLSVQPIQSETNEKHLLIEFNQLDRHLRISRE